MSPGEGPSSDGPGGPVGLPEPGSLVAQRFRIRRAIARGAMGAVYEAQDEDEGGRAVALKVLLPSLGRDDAVRRRFRREASILASVDHPVIVRVVGHGVDDGGAGGEPGAGRPWLAMERVPGTTLADRIRRPGPPLSPEELAPLLEALGAGLAAVHDRGIVHGDVKPENVLVLPPDHRGGGPPVRLVDFGLAKVEGLERLTRTGELSGTPAYLAPELITGEMPPDGRADVHGLGLVAYEALSGRPAYAGENLGQLLFAIARGRRRPLGELRPGLSERLVAAVDAALEPSPARRIPTPDAFAKAVREAVALPRRGT